METNDVFPPVVPDAKMLPQREYNTVTQMHKLLLLPVVQRQLSAVWVTLRGLHKTAETLLNENFFASTHLNSEFIVI